MPRYILGISCFYHDSAACLLKNDKIVCAFQEERFTRIKFDNSFPINSIKSCLEYANLNIKDLTCISFYENPSLKLDRIIKTSLRYGINPYKKSNNLVKWFSNKFHIENYIRKELSFEGDLFFFNHHQSHAASAFYPSPFLEAGIITMDGVGEWNTCTHSLGNNNEIKQVREDNFPHSLGMFYSAFTYYCGFKVLSGEYKLMGLAPYGTPKYINLIKDNLLEIKHDGKININLNYFEFQKYEKMFNEKLENLFGFKKRNKNGELNQDYLDIASSVQKITEEVMLKNVKSLIEKHHISNLCLAGGVALNCVANGRIDQESGIKNIWVQPASGDAGTAIGAAYLALYKNYGFERNDETIKLNHFSPFLGKEYKNSEIKTLLDNLGFKYKELADEEKWKKEIVDLILKNYVVGYFQGRMEFGPRALGSRSIIANPADVNMQKKLNLKIKFRESFRPFAPIVMDECSNDWFKIKNKNEYMLLTYFFRDEKRFDDSMKEGLKKIDHVYSKVPAVTHVDYSARAQIIKKNFNCKIYSLIEQFYKKTDIPMLINTSFNIRGEPIINSPSDALRCFMNTDMDALVLENLILIKKDQDKNLLLDENYKKDSLYGD